MQEKRGIFERIFRLFRKYAKTAADLFMKTSFDFAADPWYDKANGSREGFVMTKRMKIWTWTVFSLYLAWLVWAILFKFHLPGAGPLRTMRSIEWIPFAPREIERRQTLEEMALNLIVFIPLGAYLTALLPKGKRRWVPLIGLGASLMFEVLQYVFAIGAADVTDLIMNTAGTLSGMLFFGILHLLFKKRALTALNVLGTAGEVLFCGMLLLVMAANGRF